MALVASPLGPRGPTMQHLKHYIDLTVEPESETPSTPKRRKFGDLESEQAERALVKPSKGPRHATPIRESKQPLNCKEAASSPQSHTLITRSPFKNRPSWSTFNGQAPAPPSFSEATCDQPDQPDDSLLHPPSKVQKGPEESSPPSEQSNNASSSTGPIPPGYSAKPAVQSHSEAVPTRPLRNNSGQPRSISPIPKRVLPDSSVVKSSPLTQIGPHLTPLPDRPRNRPTSNPTKSPNTFPPAPTRTSQISVVIENSQRTANGLLSRFVHPLPEPVNDAEYRRRLVSALGSDRRIVETRASSIEAVFGPHGLSARYSIDNDKVLRKQVTQPKAKKVRLNEVQLDWGSADVPPQAPFVPQKLVRPEKLAQAILSRRFDEAREPSITFVNDVNDKQLSGKFQFISSYIRRPGVEAAPLQPTNYGCSCSGQCRPDSCSCLVDDTEVDDFGDEIDHGKIVPYQRVLDSRGKPMSVLRDDYMKTSYADGEKSEIIECNQSCGCGPDCWNRVVQNGRTLPLEIFMTAKCGFGLRSLQNIVKGQFIDLYLGEVITEAELESRELATEGAPSYVFSLDWFQQKDVYYVDSLNFGTPTRFLNHSCNPNCRVFTVILNPADSKVYGLAFFATRDILAGTELTIDYNPQEAGKVYAKPKPGDDAAVVLCQCGSRDCRVRLWPGPKRKKGKGWARS